MAEGWIYKATYATHSCLNCRLKLHNYKVAEGFCFYYKHKDNLLVIKRPSRLILGSPKVKILNSDHVSLKKYSAYNKN